MRRLIIGIAGSLAMTAGAVAPAAADAPAVDEYSESFTAADPCTGDDDALTLNFTDLIHDHDRNWVRIESATGSTDSGYTLVTRSAVEVSTTGVYTQRFTDIWHHPDGRKFEVTWRFLQNLNTGTVHYADFEVQCKSGPTLTGP